MSTINFDRHAAALLNACGYVEERFQEYWEDVGGPESGPRLVGHRAHSVWMCGDQYIIVEDGVVVEHGTDPFLLYDGAADQF